MSLLQTHAHLNRHQQQLMLVFGNTLQCGDFKSSSDTINGCTTFQIAALYDGLMAYFNIWSIFFGNTLLLSKFLEIL